MSSATTSPTAGSPESTPVNVIVPASPWDGFGHPVEGYEGCALLPAEEVGQLAGVLTNQSGSATVGTNPDEENTARCFFDVAWVDDSDAPQPTIRVAVTAESLPFCVGFVEPRGIDEVTPDQVHVSEEWEIFLLSDDMWAGCIPRQFGQITVRVFPPDQDAEVDYYSSQERVDAVETIWQRVFAKLATVR